MKISIDNMDINLNNIFGKSITLINGKIVGQKNDSESHNNIEKLFSFGRIIEIDSNTVFDIKVNNSKENENKPNDSIVVSASEQDQEKIKISENNGVLTIRSASGNFNQVTINIVSSKLNKIKLSGTGNLTGNYQGNELNISSSGTSDVSLIGSTKILTIKNSGTGDMQLNELKTDITDISNSGTGDVSLWSVKEIYGKNSGTGDIKYYGNKNHNIKNSGIGDIKFKGEKSHIEEDVSFVKNEEEPKEFNAVNLKPNDPPRKTKYRL